SDALDMIHALEAQMTVYREDSELAAINRTAGDGGAIVERELFGLLQLAARLSDETDFGFDPTTGPLVSLWSRCRKDNRIPSSVEIFPVLERTGMDHVRFDDEFQRVEYDREGVELNLGGIGKGHALDVAGRFLREEGVDEWLFHGGHSSLLACGDHNSQGGWPVGIRNPLFVDQRLASIVLRDQAMSTSGSNVQFFRYNGKRYGHILDPKSGWPVEGMLSVTVLAPTAAEADALSTAFFVRGLEIARRYCDNHPTVSALLIPPPCQGRKLDVFICGIPDEVLFFHTDDINIIREG
ncbi:MAG: FAD:protein FMN transferase, partial [Planctomycetota bacterium]|nr:FAD:protein FMN transferase [Planctomycetota bacterium]